MNPFLVAVAAGLLLMVVAVVGRAAALPIAESSVRGWIRFLTLGLPSEIKYARRTEIASDLWEHRNNAISANYAPYEIATQVVLRLLTGIPADVMWRGSQIRLGYSFRFHYAILGATALLTVVGLLTVYAASSGVGQLEYGDANYFAVRHAFYAIAGAAALLYFMRLDYRELRHLAAPIMVLALLGLAAVLIPGVGVERNGARRWLELGPISFQPGEFAKLAVIIYIATWLAGRREGITSLTASMVPFVLIVSVVSGLIIVEPDMSTAVIIVLATSTLFFVAGAPLSHLALLMAGGGLVTYSMVLAQGYRLAKLGSLVHVEGTNEVPIGVPTVGENTEALAVALAAFLYVVLLYAGARIAMAARDEFATLLSLGVTCWIGYQVALNVGGAVGVMPFTGVSLPFLSYGGSSLIAVFAAIGVLVSVSRRRVPPGATSHASP